MDLLQTSKFYKGFKKIDQLVKQKYLNFLKETANNLNYQSNVQNYIEENTSFNYKTQASIDKIKSEQQKVQKQQLDQDFIQIPTTQEQNYMHQSNYDKNPNDIKILNKPQVKGPLDMQIKQFEVQEQDEEQLLTFDQNNQALNRNILQQQIKQLAEYDNSSIEKNKNNEINDTDQQQQLLNIQQKLKQQQSINQNILSGYKLLNEQIQQLKTQQQSTYFQNIQSNLDSFQTTQFDQQNSRKVKKLQNSNFYTLKYGDIIFLKYKNENLSNIQNNQTNTNDNQFYLIVNTMNIVECVSQQADSLDNPISHFRRCLFQIIDPRQILDFQNDVNLKARQEKIKNYLKMLQQNNGKNQEPVLFGKDIMLLHIYSQQMLCISNNTPSKQEGCLEVHVNQNINEQQIFKFIPTDKSKSLGQTIFDSDTVKLVESKQNQFFINISTNSDETKHLKLNVNGSENSSPLKIKCYQQFEDLSNKNIENKEQFFDQYIQNPDQNIQTNDYVSTGDIVQLVHLDTGMLLSLTEKKISRYLIQKMCKIQNPCEENYSKQEQIFTLKQLDEKRLLQGENFDIYFEQDQKNSYTFFEIQKKNNTQGGNIDINEAFRLKNLATGLFLGFDKNNFGKLVLLPNPNDINDTECHFNFKKEKSLNNINKISYQDTFKIHVNGQFLQVSNKQKEKNRIVGTLINKNKNLQQKNFIFQLKQSSKQQREFIELSFSLYHTLLKFHFFLQKYGIINAHKDANDKGNEELVYDYQAATQNQKELEKQAQNCFNSLQSLEAQLLENKDNLEFTLKMKQNYLKEQKHLELLILIAKIIDQMIYTQKYYQKDKQRLIKIGNRNESQMKIQDKSAQNIVKRYVQKLPPKIYKLLYLSCKQNQECSYYIFDNDDFLSGELRNYPEEVSGLLKEAISNLSQIKIEDRSGDVITEWVKLLDCLDSSKQKIEDQIFYAELVSKALVDPQDNGIMKYQNKCCVEIFSRGKIGKSKALITFGMNEQKPVIIFYKENTLIEYLEENKPLQSSKKGLLPVGKYNEQDSACFYIEEICKAAPEKPDLYPYINYVAAVVQLYANLCKGRNKKSLKKMQTLGISNDHILCILKSAYTTLNLKSSYYTLYQVLFLDIEPFLSLNNTFNRNYIWDNIQNIQLNEKTMIIFGQYSENVEITKITQQFNQDMLPLLINFWEFGLPEFETDIEALIRLMQITQQRNQKEQQNSLRLKGELLVEQDQFDVFKLDREKWRQKIKLFLNILNLTKQTIDLGYLNSQILEKFVSQIVQIFQIQSKSNSYSWVREFMKNIFISKNQLEWGFDEIESDVEKILNQSCTIIQVGTQQYHQKLFDTINKLLDLKKIFLQELNMLELIDGSQEIQLYRELEGNSVGEGQIVSPFRLETQVRKIIFDENNMKNLNIKSEKKSDERMLEINNQLNKICKKLKDLKNDSNTILKAQNIFRNTGTHQSIKLLLSLNPHEKIYHDTFASIIKLFIHFCQNNNKNQLELLVIVDQLMVLLKYDLNAQKLLGLILSSLNKTVNINEYIHTIFEKLKQSEDKLEQIHILELFYSLILETPEQDDDFPLQNQKHKIKLKRNLKIINQNQKLILFKLLKDKRLISIVKIFNRKFSEYINNKKDINLFNELQSIDIRLYKAITGIIGNLVIDYPLGVTQCQRIFVYEEIKSIISKHDLKQNSSQFFIPYLAKKENLRVMYQVYICQNQQLNQKLYISEINDILYHVILQDLKNFKSYLPGLIKTQKVQHNNEEKYNETLAKRKQLTNFTKQYFLETKITDYMNDLGQYNNHGTEIIEDPQEYWEYLYSGKQWNQSKDGLLMFILDIYHEIKINQIMSFEYDTQRDALPQEDRLSDLLLALKILIEKIRNTLKIIENEIQVDLSQYILILSNCIIQNPVKKSQVSLNDNNLQIEFQIKENKLDKAFKDYKIIKSEFNKDQKKEIENNFYEKLNKLVQRKIITQEQINAIFVGEPLNDKQYSLDYDRERFQQGFFTKEEFAVGINLLLQNAQKSPYLVFFQDDITEISFDDINEFFGAFTGSAQNSYTKQTEKPVLDKKKFAKKNLAGIGLLVTIMQCSKNENIIQNIINKLDLNRLTKIANFIFQNKIKNKLEIIFQERFCIHKEIDKCSISICQNNYMTQQDGLILKLGFSIILLMELLLDQINDEQLQIRIKMNDQKYKIFETIQDLKNKEGYNQKKNTLNSNNTFTKQQKYNQLSNKKLIIGKKLSPNLQKSQNKFVNQLNSYDFNDSPTIQNNESNLQSGNKLQINSEQVSDRIQEEDELIQKKLQRNGLQKNFSQNNLQQNDSNEKYDYNNKACLQYELLIKEKLLLQDSLKFYLKFIGKVEIMKDGQLTKIFFRIPFLSNYLSSSMKQNLNLQARQCKSHKSRLELLINFSSYFQFQLRYGQYMKSHYRWVYYGIKFQIFFKYLVFILSVIINIMYVVDFQIDNNYQKMLPNLDSSKIIISWIHLIFCIIMTLIVLIDRYPLLLHQIQKKTSKKCELVTRKPIISFKLLLQMYFTDLETLYHIFYILISVLAFWYPFFYCILLVDLVKRSKQLRNIMQIITFNYKKLIKSTLLILIMIYFWAFIGFTEFSEDFEQNNEGVDFSDKKLYKYFAITVLNGLTSYGGLHDILVYRGQENENYWYRFIYDLSFWVIINFLMLNLIFGIIIDTYAEIRAQKKMEDKNLQGKCLICGLSKEDFEAQTLDWTKHLKEEHNVYNYMNYIIYIKKKHLEDCDGLEKYVKEQISYGLTDFFPKKTALSIKKDQSNLKNLNI